ncbi:MAG: T9SS type A sorting domain-containing protein, partial [FCB group bacterium]|nr:T9SS type A sorting domain-containing protein [FCB group bacterium]
DFESYATSANLQSQWGTVYGSAGVTEFSRTLNTTAGEGGSKAMKMYIDISAGANVTTGLGVNWDPCIFGITGYYTPPENQTDMTGYTGVRLWLKSGGVTGHPDVYFKLNLIEDEPSGTQEKWMSPKIYLKDLDPNGEYVYLDFKDFYQYYTSSTEAMELDKIKISYLFLAYDNNTTQQTTATVYVDDIRYVRRAYRIPEMDAMSFTLPDKFALRQNYPNPFNPVTTIQYDLPTASDVRLVIYDILGREITTLVNGRMEAGYHRIMWDGRNQLGEKVASGVYIYLLKAGDYIGSKKLLMIK